MNLGQRLKEERERLGMSQTEFASVASASKHAQINWEKGEAAPNANALAAWAGIGLDVLYVVTGVRSTQVMKTRPAALTPRQAALLDNYEHTDEAGKKIIEAAAFAAAQPKAAQSSKR